MLKGPLNDTYSRTCLEMITNVEEHPEDQYVFVDVSNLSKFRSLSTRSRIFSAKPLIFVIHEKVNL